MSESRTVKLNSIAPSTQSGADSLSRSVKAGFVLNVSGPLPASHSDAYWLLQIDRRRRVKAVACSTQSSG